MPQIVCPSCIPAAVCDMVSLEARDDREQQRWSRAASLCSGKWLHPEEVLLCYSQTQGKSQPTSPPRARFYQSITAFNMLHCYGSEFLSEDRSHDS